MKRKQAAIRIPDLLLFALLGMAMFPATGVAGEDTQAEREARREQEQGRRDMEARERAQAEALRGQQDAIRKMEATQSRLDANSQQLAQQYTDQARAASYPNYPYISPAMPVVPAVPQGAAAAHHDPVSGMSFAPLSEGLKSYFGAASGVLVLGAGMGAPFGLQDGDVIVSVDGRAPIDGPHAARILRSYQPGERVKLRVERNRRVIDLDTTAPLPRSN